MRRGSAVLLSMLPLLLPAYGLPTYFGNEASAAHLNLERAALAEADVSLDIGSPPVASTTGGTSTIPNIASEGSENWLLPRKEEKELERRQATITAGDSSVSLDVSAEDTTPIHSGGSQPAHIPNIASEGSDHWLGTAKREAIAEPEANPSPAVTLDMDYVPPALEIGKLNAGRNGLVRREVTF
ncbi:MAG: hypothetical protein Q9220_006652 [cf. Caloplaca sp. 1 TL-2023]